MIDSIYIDPRIRAKDHELIVDRTVIRVTDIIEENIEAFSDAVSAAAQSGQPILPIIIDSYGGDVYAMWSMVDILREVKVPIATIVEGKAMSCGAALFTCGTEDYRFVGPNATIMIHEVLHVPGDTKTGRSEELKADAEETERLTKRLYTFMEKNIGKRTGTLLKALKEKKGADWFLTPNEAVRMGIANHIRIPTFKTRVNVEMSLE